jgi:hypothetical protein
MEEPVSHNQRTSAWMKSNHTSLTVPSNLAGQAGAGKAQIKE